MNTEEANVGHHGGAALIGNAAMIRSGWRGGEARCSRAFGAGRGGIDGVLPNPQDDVARLDRASSVYDLIVRVMANQHFAAAP